MDTCEVSLGQYSLSRLNCGGFVYWAWDITTKRELRGFLRSLVGIRSQTRQACGRVLIQVLYPQKKGDLQRRPKHRPPKEKAQSQVHRTDQLLSTKYNTIPQSQIRFPSPTKNHINIIINIPPGYLKNIHPYPPPPCASNPFSWSFPP